MGTEGSSLEQVTYETLAPAVIPDIKFSIRVSFVMGKMLDRTAVSGGVSASRLVDAATGWCLDPVSEEIRDEYNIPGRLNHAITHQTQFPVPISIRTASTRKQDIIQFGSELGYREE